MRLLTKLKSKIHRATVSFTDLNYEGSCGICPDIMAAADIEEYEQIHIYNLDNGERFTTYAIKSTPGTIAILGAAARKVEANDKIIICTFVQTDCPVIPIVVQVNQYNEILDHKNPTIL